MWSPLGARRDRDKALWYETVMKVTLLPGGRRLFSQGGGQASWVFPQDNDPPHKLASTHVKVWNSKHGASVRILEQWPPNSPDLNPIENVWGWMEAKINQLGCKSWADFKAASCSHSLRGDTPDHGGQPVRLNAQEDQPCAREGRWEDVLMWIPLLEVLPLPVSLV
jgi:hypothetical protein